MMTNYSQIPIEFNQENFEKFEPEVEENAFVFAAYDAKTDTPPRLVDQGYDWNLENKFPALNTETETPQKPGDKGFGWENMFPALSPEKPFFHVPFGQEETEFGVELPETTEIKDSKPDIREIVSLDSITVNKESATERQSYRDIEASTQDIDTDTDEPKKEDAVDEVTQEPSSETEPLPDHDNESDDDNVKEDHGNEHREDHGNEHGEDHDNDHDFDNLDNNHEEEYDEKDDNKDQDDNENYDNKNQDDNDDDKDENEDSQPANQFTISRYQFMFFLSHSYRRYQTSLV